MLSLYSRDTYSLRQHYRFRSLLLVALLLVVTEITWAQPLSAEGIYNHLHAKFPQYNNVTYAEPSENYLTPGDWLVQTPNSWGTSLSTYNQGFTPKGHNKIDPQFFVPTCQTQADCGGVSKCKTAAFTRDDRKLCLSSAHKVMEIFYNTFISANSTVDITTLGKPIGTIPLIMHPTDFAYTSTLRNAITTLGHKSIATGKPITIRLLEGAYPPFISEHSEQALESTHNSHNLQLGDPVLEWYLEDITSGLPANNKVTVSVANERSCSFKPNCGNHNDQQNIILKFSFNHGKTVIVDNSTVIAGGQDLWGDDYAGINPVNDSSIKISGAVAAGATAYMNTLWKYMSDHPSLLVNHCSTYSNGVISGCITDATAPNTRSTVINTNTFPVQAMFVSKLNNGVGVGDDADQSEVARVFALKNATTSIKISQQALFKIGHILPFARHPILHPLGTIDGNVIQAIAHAIRNHSTDVYIVTSQVNHTSYASPVDLQYLYDAILHSMKSDCDLNTGDAEEKLSSRSLQSNCYPDDAKAKQALNKHLHLAYLNYTDSTDSTIRAHNKFWMVDDKVFYFGSHNFYPSSLQQFGVIVDSTMAATDLNNTFWTPMWFNSNKFTPK